MKNAETEKKHTVGEGEKYLWSVWGVWDSCSSLWKCKAVNTDTPFVYIVKES